MAVFPSQSTVCTGPCREQALKQGPGKTGGSLIGSPYYNVAAHVWRYVICDVGQSFYGQIEVVYHD